ncbi:hypothetical protein NBRC116598_21470 [Pseudophaeobacter arcticus]|uniref:Uncharacterized protein n=1 Tax=Pseudophaeobacter arcticus TaxID=385492 RepID=A0ABQ0ALJ3_9RHOB
MGVPRPVGGSGEGIRAVRGFPPLPGEVAKIIAGCFGRAAINRNSETGKVGHVHLMIARSPAAS